MILYMPTKVKAQLTLAFVFVYSLVFEDEVHALVVGVPILAISVLKLTVIFITFLSVPLTAFVHFIKKGSKIRSLLISGAILLVVFALSYSLLALVVSNTRDVSYDKPQAAPEQLFEEPSPDADMRLDDFYDPAVGSPPLERPSPGVVPDPLVTGPGLGAPREPLLSSDWIIFGALFLLAVFVVFLLPVLMVNYALFKLGYAFERKKAVVMASALLSSVLAIVVYFFVVSFMLISMQNLVL